MKLYREVHGSHPADDLSVESLLAELMANAARVPSDVKGPRPAWLRRTIDKLSIEYAERLTLDDLSREAGVHPVHLSRVFRKCVGEGIGEHVRRLRVRAACEHMRFPEVSIAEISVALEYKAAAGPVARTLASLVGWGPEQIVRESLRHLKQLMEAGEIPTTAGQPVGARGMKGAALRVLYREGPTEDATEQTRMAGD